MVRVIQVEIYINTCVFLRRCHFSNSSSFKELSKKKYSKSRAIYSDPPATVSRLGYGNSGPQNGLI